MKKFLLTLIVAATLMCSSVAMAADGGDLNKAQGSAEKFMAAFTAKPVVYTEASAGFSKELKNKINDKVYVELQKQVKAKFGNVKESRFHAYQRFDGADRVTYIAACTKEKLVAFVLVCDKTGKIIDFAISPLQADAKK